MQLLEYKVDSGLQAVCHLQPVLRVLSHLAAPDGVVDAVSWRKDFEKPVARHFFSSSLEPAPVRPGLHVWGKEEAQRFFLLKKKFFYWTIVDVGFPGSSGGKESACSAGDPGSIPGL